MTGDLLLAWMSETGQGRLRDLRNRAEWLARTHGIEASKRSLGRWLRDTAALAHAEVDWAGDRWCVAPPVLVRLPQADGVAVLAGARRPGLVALLAQTDLAVTEHPPRADTAAPPLPTAVFVQFDSLGDLRASAEQANVTYVGCFAERFASHLPHVELGAMTAPPAATNDTLHRRTGPRPSDWQPTSAASKSFTDGLYRVEVNGREEFRTVRSGHWYRATLADAVWLEHERTEESCVRWRADDDGRAEVGRLFVDFGAPLPPLQARVLTMCSGLPPRLSEAAQTLTYRNVPRRVAQQVAASLHQPLAVDQ